MHGAEGAILDVLVNLLLSFPRSWKPFQMKTSILFVALLTGRDQRPVGVCQLTANVGYSDGRKTITFQPFSITEF